MHPVWRHPMHCTALRRQSALASVVIVPKTLGKSVKVSRLHAVGALRQRARSARCR